MMHQSCHSPTSDSFLTHPSPLESSFFQNCFEITKFLSFLQIISPTALFLAAKVEEQARKLEHVIKVAHTCLHPLEPLLDTKCDVCKGGVFCFFSLSLKPFHYLVPVKA